MTAFWLPAALSADVPIGTVMPVETATGTLALWRSRAGRLQAFSDRCPHRGMRLSYGFVRGEALSCIYHGWRYGAEGRCLRIPAHPDLVPPPAIRAQAHEVEESDGVVWIAQGERTCRPPRLGGVSPLRSLTANAPFSMVEEQGVRTETAGLYRIEATGARLAVLLAPQPDARTLIHAFVDETSDAAERVAASRAAETLRRTVERAVYRAVA